MTRIKSHTIVLFFVGVFMAFGSSARADTYKQYRQNIKDCWKDYRTHNSKIDLSLCIADAVNAYLDQKFDLFGSLVGALAFSNDGRVLGVGFAGRGEPLHGGVTLATSVGEDGTLEAVPGENLLHLFVASEELLGTAEQDLDANQVEWMSVGTFRATKAGDWQVHFDKTYLPDGNYLFAASFESDPTAFDTDTSEGSPIAFLPLTIGADERKFIRGDVNGDGDVNIADAISVLEYLFAGGEPPPCPDAADVNDDGIINIADPVALLSALFVGDFEISPPFPEPGVDPTEDSLGCHSGESDDFVKEPCEGATPGNVYLARSECRDGFWAVVTYRAYHCPDGSVQFVEDSVESTNQPCP